MVGINGAPMGLMLRPVDPCLIVDDNDALVDADPDDKALPVNGAPTDEALPDGCAA